MIPPRQPPGTSNPSQKRRWRATRAHFYYTDHEGCGPEVYYCDLDIEEVVAHDSPEVVKNITFKRDPQGGKWTWFGNLTWAPPGTVALLEKAWSDYMASVILGGSGR